MALIFSILTFVITNAPAIFDIVKTIIAFIRGLKGADKAAALQELKATIKSDPHMGPLQRLLERLKAKHGA